MPDHLQPATVALHGHKFTYLKCGRGPVLLLLHGVLASRESWGKLVPILARHYTVIAPDFLGSGDSAKPRGDYSLGAHAAALRDLLDRLHIDRVTLVGHSLGGGVAMQFIYLFPERCERLVLVSSGGLGRELSLLLRAAALPGAELVLPLFGSRWVHDSAGRVGDWLKKVGLHPTIDARELSRGCLALRDAEVRRSFLATVHTVIDRGGQMVSALNRLHVLERIPVLIVWGARDRMIPLKHGIEAHRSLRGSHLEIFPEAGHFPHLADPERFVEVLDAFVRANPARVEKERGKRTRQRRPRATARTKRKPGSSKASTRRADA